MAASVSPSQSAISIRGLRKIYGDTGAGLRGLNMTVPRGGIHGFLGRNGAGKTTTMKCLMGLLHSDGGEFEILGQSYDPLSDARVRVHLGYAPEAGALPEYFTGAEALESYGRLHGLTKTEVPLERSRILGWLDLQDAAQNRVKSYSKGMRARLAIGVAMMGDPEILVLDEPTSGLDPVSMASLRQLLEELVRGSGNPRTILLSSHQLGEVQRICSNLTIIDSGQTVAEGRVEDLVRRISGGDFYRAEFRNLSDQLASGIAQLPGLSLVSRVAGIPGGIRFRVDNDEDPREELARIALQHGGLLLTCERETVSVEDLFLAFVTGGQPPAMSPQPSLWPVPPEPSPRRAPDTLPAPSIPVAGPSTPAAPPTRGTPIPGPTSVGVAEAPPGVCPRCQTPWAAEDLFCHHCGGPRAASAPPAPPSGVSSGNPPPPPVPSVETQPPPASVGKTSLDVPPPPPAEMGVGILPPPLNHPPPPPPVAPVPGPVPCPHCGALNDPAHKFCLQCGTRLPPA